LSASIANMASRPYQKVVFLSVASASLNSEVFTADLRNSLQGEFEELKLGINKASDVRIFSDSDRSSIQAAYIQGSMQRVVVRVLLPMKESTRQEVISQHEASLSALELDKMLFSVEEKFMQTLSPTEGSDYGAWLPKLVEYANSSLASRVWLEKSTFVHIPPKAIVIYLSERVLNEYAAHFKLAPSGKNLRSLSLVYKQGCLKHSKLQFAIEAIRAEFEQREKRLIEKHQLELQQMRNELEEGYRQRSQVIYQQSNKEKQDLENEREAYKQQLNELAARHPNIFGRR